MAQTSKKVNALANIIFTADGKLTEEALVAC